MWFPEKKNKEFDYPSKKNPASLFIAFAWREFFEVTTPPCYKPNLLNTLHLIKELEDSAQRALKDERWKKHLEAVLRELKSYAEQDQVLSTYFSNVQYQIKSLEKAGTSPKTLERLSIVIQGYLKDYEDKVRLHFEQAIDFFSKDPKKKENMLRALKSLATLVVSQNLSSEVCRSILNESHLSSEPCEIGQVILTALSPVEQQWGCVFALKGNLDFLRALTTDSQFVTSKSNKEYWESQLEGWKHQRDKEIENFLDNTGGYQLYVYQKDIQGKSVFQVFESSFGLLKRLLGVANLYHHSIAFEIAPYAFVENQDTKVQQLFSVHSGTSFPPSHKIAKNLLKYLQNSESTGHGFDQAINSLEQYSLAHSTWDLKARFVHLWVALEALTGFAEKEGSIIGHLTTQITPIIVPHYLHSMVKYLAICLHEFGFCNRIKNSTGGFTKSTREQIRPDELLLALTRAHENDCIYGEDIVGKLLKVVSPEHPLLGNHIFTACCKIFTARTCSQKGERQESEKTVKKILSDYKDSTEWQLQRIYRARNLLVHEGTAVPQLQYLFEQLNYYYSVTFSAVIDDVQKRPQWSVDHSFLHRRLNFERLLDLLNKSPSMLTVADVLPKEEGNIEPLWTAATGS